MREWHVETGLPFYMGASERAEYVEHIEDLSLSPHDMTKISGNGCNIMLLGVVFATSVYTSWPAVPQDAAPALDGPGW